MERDLSLSWSLAPTLDFRVDVQPEVTNVTNALSHGRNMCRVTDPTSLKEKNTCCCREQDSSPSWSKQILDMVTGNMSA
jgi:hypothetical protein